MAATDQTSQQHPAKVRSIQFGLRSLLIAAAVVACILALWATFLRPYAEHGRQTRRFNTCFEKLTHKRPADLTRKQWSFMLGWTNNAWANCLSLPEFIMDKPRFRRFLDELERRVEGDVTTETIDWIWDEIEEMSVYGERYSENWRPTTPEHLKEAEWTSFGVSVD